MGFNLPQVSAMKTDILERQTILLKMGAENVERMNQDIHI
jgi:hypothetical protein